MKFFGSFEITNFFKKKIDNKLLDEFEEILIQSDVGIEVAAEIKGKIKKRKKLVKKL